MSFVHRFFPAKADKPFLRYSLPPCGRSSQRDECANGQPRLGDVGSDGFRKVWPAAVLWLCPCGSLWRLGVRTDLGIKSTAAWMVAEFLESLAMDGMRWWSHMDSYGFKCAVCT